MESVGQQDPVAVENPHDLTRQIVGLVFWISIFILPTGDWIAGAAALVLGSLTFADAWIAGIFKNRDSRKFMNISPMGWGIVVPMLLIVGLPAYAYGRNKLKTRDGNNVLFGAVLLIGSSFLLSVFVQVWAAVSGGQGV